MIRSPTQPRVYRMIGAIDALFSRNPSGWGSRDNLDAIEPLILPFMKGRIRVRFIHLPQAACDFGMRNNHSTRSETLAHSRMKSAAIAWMKAEGAKDAWEERPCIVGRADAYSDEARWVVECGHTAMGKLTSAVACAKPTRFSLIPFQTMTWRDGSTRRLVAADFHWDAGLQPEVEAFLHAKNAALFANMPDWGHFGFGKRPSPAGE